MFVVSTFAVDAFKNKKPEDFRDKAALNIGDTEKVTRVDLEHEDAPVLKKYSIAEFRSLLAGFSRIDVVPERFPVKTRLHGGLKGALYNTCFVGLFNAMPRALVRRFGWHLLAFCEA